MRKKQVVWELPPLSFEDQRLRDAYLCADKPVDQLPYSAEFNRLIRRGIRNGRSVLFRFSPCCILGSVDDYLIFAAPLRN